MTRIEGTIVIAAHPQDVFDFVADERNEPLFNRDMVGVEKLTPEPIGLGTRWSTTLASRGRGGRRGRPITMTVEVVDYDRPTRLGTRSTLSTAVITGALTFAPHPSGTRLSWSWDVSPKGALRLLTPVIGVAGRREERRVWSELKRRLEQSSTARAVRR